MIEEKKTSGEQKLNTANQLRKIEMKTIPAVIGDVASNISLTHFVSTFSARFAQLYLIQFVGKNCAARC